MNIEINSPKYGLHIVEIDDEDYEFIKQYAWHINYHGNNVYAIATVRDGSVRTDIKMHRLILKFPENHIDHRDGNGLNNKKSNLRLTVPSQNNKSKRSNSRNTTGYKGVTFHKRDNTFQVAIKSNGVAYYSCGHKTAIEAAKKYNEMALKHHGEFAYLNKTQYD